MKNTITLILLLAILFFAIITRFYKLGLAPAGLYLDEAAQGYNAYSILLTGRDEFGKSFPVVFRSFTDFKTPVYIYLVVPLISIFDLTKFTVRLPSAIFSILTLPFFFLLVKNLRPKKELRYGILNLETISALLLAISPWHILFGRTNFETNVAIFFFIAGLYFFYKGLRKPWILILSAVFFAIAIPSYHSQRIITPLTILVLFIKYRKILFSEKHRKFLYIGLLVGFIILLPTLSVMTTPGFLRRASGLNIFNQKTQHSAGFVENCNNTYCLIINNPFYLSIKEFTALYTSYFSPRNMFILGDSGPRSSFPELSTYFLWQLPFYIYGLWILLKNKKLGEIKFLTITLLLITPIPASVTRDPYSTIRSQPLVIPQIIIISIGIIFFYAKLKKLFPRYKLLIYLLVSSASLGLIIYSLFKLYSSVLILNEYYRAEYWNYGWEEVAKSIETIDQKMPIVVDNSRSEPYSQLLFFLKFDPGKYQQNNFEVPINEYYFNLNRNKTKTIGNIITRLIIWGEDIYKDQYLIGDNLSISASQIEEHKLEIIKEVTYPDGSIAFIIVKTNPKEKCASLSVKPPVCK